MRSRIIHGSIELRSLVLAGLSMLALAKPNRLFAQASAARPAMPGLTSLPSAITLQPGDALRITVFRSPELSGEFAIALDGSITHPLYKSVKVAGIPMPAVETQLRAFIRQFVTADSLFVIEPLLRVVVGGDVRTPNVYTLRPETSISQALAVAGGPTERGRRDRVLLVRDGRATTIDLTGAGTMGRMLIRSGDEVVVEEQRSTFREIVLPAVALLGSVAAIVNVFLIYGK